MNIKKTAIATLTLATLVASPAFAQTNTQRIRHANTAAENSYAAAAPNWNASARNPNVVVYGNTVVGQDPDVNIRLQLLRDPGSLNQ